MIQPPPATDLFEMRAPFADAELARIAEQYAASPVDLACPRCRPGRMEVADFLEPEPDRNGYAMPAEPKGVYVVLLRCRGCGREGMLTLTPHPD